MSDIAITYLGFLVFALITLMGAISVVTITGYSIASAETPDEKLLAWYDFSTALLMFGALGLVFILMVLSFLAIEFKAVFTFLVAHRWISFTFTAGFFLLVAASKYSLLPFRYYFVKRFGTLPTAARRAVLRRITPVTMDDVLHDIAILTVAERKQVLLQLTKEVK